MSFSDEYLALCVENVEMLEGFWEPKFGELVLCWDVDNGEWSKDLWLVIGRYSDDAIDVFRERDGAIGAALIVDCAPLPSQRQLQVMLEERGWDWTLSNSIGAEGNSVVLSRCGGVIDSNDIMAKTGPDPETALLRALVSLFRDGVPEVVKGATDN